MRLYGDAWRALLAPPALRGVLAGYTGTATLEEVDDDEHTARFRLQGIRDGATATAMVTATLRSAWDATEVQLEVDVHPGHRSDLTAERLVAAVSEALGGADVASSGRPGVPAPPAPKGRK